MYQKQQITDDGQVFMFSNRIVGAWSQIPNDICKKCKVISMNCFKKILWHFIPLLTLAELSFVGGGVMFLCIDGSSFDYTVENKERACNVRQIMKHS